MQVNLDMRTKLCLNHYMERSSATVALLAFGLPHWPQNFAPACTVVPHWVQFAVTSEALHC
jgi:hypothetical protein